MEPIFQTDSYNVFINDDKTGYTVVNREYGIVEETTEVLPMAMSLAVNWDVAIKKIREHKEADPTDMLTLLGGNGEVFN